MIRRLISLAHPLRRYRRLGVVAAALLGSYALAGFLLVPWVVQRTAVASLAESLQRPVRVDGVSFNPFALSAEIRGFVVAEVDGSRVFAFERLYANLQASSLLRWAWTFRELHLEGPALEVIRDADGALNLARLAPRAETGAAAPPAQTAPAAAPRLVVGELVIARGTVHVEDRLPATDFETVIGPVNVEMFDLSTLPDDEGQYQIAVTTELGSRLQWSGSVQISPLRSSGHVTGSGPFAALLSRFVQDTVAFTLPEGRLELAFDYTLGAAGDGGFFATVDGAELAVLDIALQHDAGAAPFLTLTEARLRGGAVRWPERSATAELVSLVGARLAATRSPSGELDLLGLAEAAPAEAPGEPDGSAGERDVDPFGGWSLGVAELRVADFRASFEDRTLPTPATLELADLDLTLHDLTSAPGAQSRYELAARLGAGGELASAGTVSAWPGVSLAGSLTATQIPLGAAQPYVGELARVAIEGGTVDAELEIAISPQQRGRAAGSLSVDGFELHNAALAERLVGWSALEIAGLTLDLSAGSLELSEVLLRSPYLRLLIAEDRSTNFGALTQSRDTAPTLLAQAGAPPTNPRPLDLTVGRFEIVDGSSDFTDLSLPLPFATHITELAGEITTLVTSSAEPAELDLEGQIEEYGLARIAGTISARGPADSMDLSVLFRNVAMPDLSPYTAEFAGRTIADGRLDLDLRYAVDDGVLTGQNGIVIADLELGESIDSPGAADLPLDLAVALLKGPDGRITIDLPVSGDLDDPQFNIGSVIRSAFGDLIKGFVTSPFRLLGRLIGVESEDFGEIEFEAGEAVLTPPEREKLANLAEALELRPELALVVAAVVAPEADSAALKAARVDARIDAAVAATTPDASLIARRRQAIETDFRARLPDTPLEPILAAHTRPADPASAAGLDESAYLASLLDQLVSAEPLGPTELAELGRSRATVVRDAITASGVDPARVELGDIDEVTPSDSGWIPLELDVADAD